MRMMACNVQVRYVIVKCVTEFLKVTAKLLAIVVVGENDHTFGYGNDVVQ